MKSCFYLLLLIALVSSCRLDSNAFNPNVDPITAYTLDAYTGPVDVELDASFDLDPSLIHLFTMQSDDNGEIAEIYAVYIGDTNRISIDTVIMYCHGNKNHMDFYWPRAKLLANMGAKNRFGVLMVDYRGYGLSEGSPSESGLYADVTTSLQWLKDRGLTDDRLAMYGFSLGSAPATELTANPRAMTPAWLMLEAPFASAEVMGQDAAMMALPGSYTSNLELDNAEEIKKVNQPFLWIHGVDDDFLSFETHGKVVSKNYHGVRKQEVLVQGAGHSDIPNILGHDYYNSLLLDFLTY